MQARRGMKLQNSMQWLSNVEENSAPFVYDQYLPRSPSLSSATNKTVIGCLRRSECRTFITLMKSDSSFQPDACIFKYKDMTKTLSIPSPAGLLSQRLCPR